MLNVYQGHSECSSHSHSHKLVKMSAEPQSDYTKCFGGDSTAVLEMFINAKFTIYNYKHTESGIRYGC